MLTKKSVFHPEKKKNRAIVGKCRKTNMYYYAAVKKKYKSRIRPNLERARDELPLRCEVVDLVVSRVGHGLVVAAPEDGRGGEGLQIKGNIIFMGK